MKPTPIAEVIRRIQPLAPARKAAHLRALIECESKRSYRRSELEAALKHVVNTDLQRANGVKH